MSAATFRAPGATIADKAAVCLLLAALATLWLFERNYSLEQDMYGTGVRTGLTLQSLTLAANLAPEHRFLMFLRQTGVTPEDRAYVPYNRFPIGAYLALKGALWPFGHDLAAQIRAAQSVALLFFAGAAVLAYLALRRLQHGPWAALTATLLAFSSFYSLHYADMVSSEIASLFGIWLTAHGLVRFAHDERLRPLLAKAGIALWLGWHVMGLLLPFVVLGLARTMHRAYAIGGAGPRAGLTALRGSPYLRLGLAAALFCTALLAFNVANEYVALEGETPWIQLPTVQSFLEVSILHGEQSVGFYKFAAEQLRRIGRLTVPYALVRGLGYEYNAAPTFFMATGLAVCSLCLLGLRGARPRRVRAAWLLSGWIWALAVPNSAHWHDFETLFHIGLPLLFFAQGLQGLRRRVLSKACLPGAAVVALLLFSLSAREVSRRLPALDAFPAYRATLADFTAMRPLVAGRSVCVPAHLELWTGSGIVVGADLTRLTPLSYYLAGSQVDYSQDYCASSPSDFTLAPVRVEGPALLTPANRVLFLYAVPALEETPYRAALRALLAAAPLARAEFDLYAHAQALVYYRPTACRPADRQERFFLSIEPVRGQDLPAPRRQFGFDNLNFNWHRRGLQFHRQCLALVPLPAYPLARIHTGQFIRGGGGVIWETAFPFRPTYEAALRAVQATAPIARAAFDVHARARTLVYRKAVCDPAEMQARFFLHVVPVHSDDLPAHRRAHGFDNLDFDGTRRGMHLDHQCLALAPLPAYSIARIRTGQGIRADAQFWETAFPFRPTYEAALRAVQATAPIARAEFDVYARARTLVYRKAACGPADVQARFFLHVEPVNVDDLPAHRQPHGFDNLDFDFARRGAQLNRQCLVIVPLPRYPIARIRTGQGARADGANWEVEVHRPVQS